MSEEDLMKLRKLIRDKSINGNICLSTEKLIDEIDEEFI